MRRYLQISPVAAVVIACAIIVGIPMFITPIHGYSDNGDFQMLLASNDLFQLPHTKIGYTIQKYGLMRHYNQLHLEHLTTQSVVIQIAVALNRWFYSRSIFDLRFLGAIHYLLYLGGVATFANGLIGRKKRRRNYLLAIVLTLILADSAFTLYLNSFYPQALTLILMLYLAGLFLSLMCYKQENVWQTFSFFAVAFLLLMVHESNSLLCIGLIIAGIGVLSRPHHHLIHGMMLCFTALLLLVGWISANNLSPEASQMNKYQAMTQGKLLTTSHPESISQTTNIDPQFTLMRAQSYYPNGYAALKAEDAETKRQFTQRYDLPWLISAYATDLPQMGRLLDVTAKNTMLLRPKFAGTQAAKPGSKPQFKTKYFTLFSQMLATFYPRKYAFNCLLAAAIAIVYGFAFVRHLKRGERWLASRFWLVIGLLAIVIASPPAVVVLYGTADLSIHIFPVAFSLCLVGMVLLSDVVQHRLWRNTNERQT
ncbi:hypothetical protein [Secundilactobacillus folii]|uniref:Transmembrane protein n=1 Tax=Secundilactobacillus folii TaxID=2678357 RepID=A0A7X2XVG8_9LACO|nr:hypothetical protein [Secundilactobacillus folii]MTV81805.1 hypothetical protein [Secundilactobacillus folii]